MQPASREGAHFREEHRGGVRHICEAVVNALVEAAEWSASEDEADLNALPGRVLEARAEREQDGLALDLGHAALEDAQRLAAKVDLDQVALEYRWAILGEAAHLETVLATAWREDGRLVISQIEIVKVPDQLDLLEPQQFLIMLLVGLDPIRRRRAAKKAMSTLCRSSAPQWWSRRRTSGLPTMMRSA